MKDSNQDRPVAVITGASRGIGAETARLLARRGYAIVLAARSEGPLRELAAELNRAGALALAVPVDVRKPADLQQLALLTRENFGRVDVLLHNAGVVHPGIILTELCDQEVESILATNLVAPIELTRALLPMMAAQGRGFIGFVDSVGGHIGLPSASLYSATKFGLRGFAEALRREWKPRGLDVCVISPGFIKTELTEPVWEIMAGYPMHMGTPASVARAIVRAIDHPRREVILPRYYRLFIWTNQTLPFLVDGVMSLYMRHILPRYKRPREKP